jgi:hypothetical protein
MRRNLSLMLIAALLSFTGCGRTSKSYVIAHNLPAEYQGRKLSQLYVVVETGGTYRFASAQVIGDAVRGMTTDGRALSIPLADVRYAWQVDTSDQGLHMVLVPLAVIGVAAVAVVTAAALTSCPFVYGHDGERYVLAAEPLGGAISAPLQRTDYVPVERLAPTDGRYRLRLANELDETQYVDAFELWAVDHSKDVRVAIDSGGGIHTLTRPEPPLAAVVNGEQDVLRDVCARDGLSWASDMDAKSAAAQPRLRDDVEMTFAKPRAARQAKLLLQMSHTPWATVMFKRYLAMLPANASEWAQRASLDQGARDAVRQLVKRQGLLHVELSVWDGKEWRAPQYVAGGSPLVPHQRVLVLDVADVPGDQLKVRLRAVAGLWMVDQVAADFSADQAVDCRRLSVRSARTTLGEDVGASLQADDRSYYVLPSVGASADVEFDAPPLAQGRTRSTFVKIGGYYEIHADGPRDSQAPPLLSLLMDPDAAARQSVQLFRERIRPQRADARPAVQ